MWHQSNNHWRGVSGRLGWGSTQSINQRWKRSVMPGQSVQINQSSVDSPWQAFVSHSITLNTERNGQGRTKITGIVLLNDPLFQECSGSFDCVHPHVLQQGRLAVSFDKEPKPCTNQHYYHRNGTGRIHRDRTGPLISWWAQGSDLQTTWEQRTKANLRNGLFTITWHCGFYTVSLKVYASVQTSQIRLICSKFQTKLTR